MAGIYIHIPFCKQACHYCDFHFSTSKNGHKEMTKAIIQELEMRKDYLRGETIETVYFGGGSPSILPIDQIAKILDSVQKLYSNNWKEVTLEANPDDLTNEKLKGWFQSGINRLSLGIQSFHDDRLKFYNRAHNSKEALVAINKARDQGFEKFNLDLIYGHPSSDHKNWIMDLNTALEMDPGHLSCYALTVEPRTALGHWEKTRKFIPANEDFVSEEFEILLELAKGKGYEQYEISNFARSGEYSLHNTNYWKQVPYLGVGPSAHSFDGTDRGLNPSNNQQYIKTLQAGTSPFKIDPLSPEEKINEYLLTSLRTKWGADLDYLKISMGYDLIMSKNQLLETLDAENLIVSDGKAITLTSKGKLLTDSIASSLFID